MKKSEHMHTYDQPTQEPSKSNNNVGEMLVMKYEY